MLTHCQCIFSGQTLEDRTVSPRFPVRLLLGRDQHIFMSATITDDAFLVKGLQLKPETILYPLSYTKESWSGEKMVFLPSLPSMMISTVRPSSKGWPLRSRTRVMVCRPTPSFDRTKDWKATWCGRRHQGHRLAGVDALKKAEYENTIVLANRYAASTFPTTHAELPTSITSRIQKPDRSLQEDCRPESDATLMRTIRSVEQGMGRSVRGEKDYSVVVVIGTDIIRFDPRTGIAAVSPPQSAAQIEWIANGRHGKTGDRGRQSPWRRFQRPAQAMPWP